MPLTEQISINVTFWLLRLCPNYCLSSTTFKDLALLIPNMKSKCPTNWSTNAKNKSLIMSGSRKNSSRSILSATWRYPWHWPIIVRPWSKEVRLTYRAFQSCRFLLWRVCSHSDPSPLTQSTTSPITRWSNSWIPRSWIYL